jgi:exodeoxyribonuclease VII large subunit
MQLALTISELTRIIKASLEYNPALRNVWVKGEISNLTMHSSGHVYFSIKDSGAVISAALFKGDAQNVSFKLAEGLEVLALGNISVYEKRGSYQIIVKELLLEGIGELQRQIDELKKRLFKEGIFDPSRKRPIPFLPRRIGVVTSPTGAAFRDILKVALRRHPSIEVLLAPAKVQGNDAPQTIVRAIEELNKPKYSIDLIIAGRGGGSFEDLLPFNDEAVVRAFAGSRIPIISAVGHQIDHPLTDDAADAYAPTPSAAAEMAVPVVSEIRDELTSFLNRSENIIKGKINEHRKMIESHLSRRVFADPKNILYMKEIRLDEIRNNMVFSLRETLSRYKYRFAGIPDPDKSVRQFLDKTAERFTRAVISTEHLSPMKILQRGYAAAVDIRGAVIKSVDNIKPDDRINLFVADGRINCTVMSAEKGARIGKA